MMTGAYKQFDKELFEKNDPIGRAKVINFFKSKGIEAEDSKEKYGIDVIAEALTPIKYIEVARRSNWKNTAVFPRFSGPHTIHIEERKLKFLERHGPFYYAIINEYNDRLAICGPKSTAKYMTPEHLRMKPNKYKKMGEKFFNVPVTEFNFYHQLPDGSWKQISRSEYDN